jgi:glucokinase
MLLGIEIGGTKLQLGVGSGDGTLVALERFDVEAARGAGGILASIQAAGQALAARHQVRAIGIGFGGPVDPTAGKILKSHQIDGWQDFPITEWVQKTFGLPVGLGNDADLAGLAEARLGAGKGRNPVFYVTVGTGIGGGLIVDEKVYRGSGLGAAEIGHLRPGLNADRPEETIESIASGWGIAAAAQAHLVGPVSHRLKPFMAGGSRPLKPEAVRQHLIAEEEATEEYAADLLERCDGEVERLTAKIVAQAAADGNAIALDVLHHAWQVLGWGIAQMITLLAPAAVVIGGGVSLMGEQLFFNPLRSAVERYVFPPFLGTFEILPAKLGEEMVVHGALALAADQPTAGNSQ